MITTPTVSGEPGQAPCADCNNGWMSRIEIRVQRLLDPVMRTNDVGGPDLSVDNQALLAAWFTKCAYAYEAAVFSEGTRAWRPKDFQQLRSSQEAPGSVTIWIGKSVGLLADIVLSVTPLGLISIDADASHEPGWPQIVGAWLSANSVVMFGLWMPAEMIEADLPSRLTGDDTDAMIRIWPPALERIGWPARCVGDEEAWGLINLVAGIRDGQGIRVNDLNYAEIEHVKAEMRAHASADGFRPPYAFVNRVRATR